jgi:hypothetical protein
VVAMRDDNNARVPGNSEGGDPMGGVTPPPRGEGPPPTGGQRLK